MDWSTARATALAGFVALALVPASSLAVYADANPANHGHHYGQLKHRAAPPPTATNPPPATAPPPRATAPPPGAPSPGGTQGTGAGTGPGVRGVMLTPLQIRLVFPRVTSGQVNLVDSAPKGDQAPWWLLLILVVSLAALWLLTVFQLARAGLKRRPGLSQATV